MNVKFFTILSRRSGRMNIMGVDISGIARQFRGDLQSQDAIKLVDRLNEYAGKHPHKTALQVWQAN